MPLNLLSCSTRFNLRNHPSSNRGDLRSHCCGAGSFPLPEFLLNPHDFLVAELEQLPHPLPFVRRDREIDADTQAATRGELERDQIHAALFRPFGLAFQIGQHEPRFLAGADLRGVDGEGEVGDHGEGPRSEFRRRMGSVHVTSLPRWDRRAQAYP